MSIINTFDAISEEVIRPDSITDPVDGFPETVVITFHDRIIDALKVMCPVEIISELHAGFTIPIYKFDFHGRELGMYMTSIGGAATTALMEEVAVKGAKKFLLFGSCGVLDHTLTAGHFILPTSAYRDEGTSYHYLPAGDYVEVATAERLGEIFDELDLPYVFGKTWTTDAFYRETRRNVDARKADGCIAVEMECASVMAAAQFRNIPVYQFLYAEDSLAGEDWDSRTMGIVPHSDMEKYLKVALETAVRI